MNVEENIQAEVVNRETRHQGNRPIQVTDSADGVDHDSKMRKLAEMRSLTKVDVKMDGRK